MVFTSLSSPATFWFFPGWRNRLGYYLYLLFYHPSQLFISRIRQQDPRGCLDGFLSIPRASCRSPHPAPQDQGCGQWDRVPTCAQDTAGGGPCSPNTMFCASLLTIGRHYCHGLAPQAWKPLEPPAESPRFCAQRAALSWQHVPKPSASELLTCRYSPKHQTEPQNPQECSK